MQKKRILLHTCCAPCFSGTYDKLVDNYELSLFWFNPNIDTKEEENKRFDQFQKLPWTLDTIRGDYTKENKNWENLTSAYSQEPEGGKRCELCFAFRLKKSAEKAKELGIPLFTTTLSISPHKNAVKINQIGQEIGKAIGVEFLPSDFKKGDGYLHSILRSKEFGLYRQEYCGCKYSKKLQTKS